MTSSAATAWKWSGFPAASRSWARRRACPRRATATSGRSCPPSPVAARREPSAPLLLVDVETEEGVTGHAYLFCYLKPAAVAIASFAAEVERLMKGQAIE